MISAILFDKDGVLIDSFETCFMATNDAIKKYGNNELSKQKYKKEFWGVDVYVNFNRIFKGLSKSNIEEMVEYYDKKRTEYIDLTKLYPNTIQVLDFLKEKYKLGVITSTTKKLAIKILSNFNILKYFDVIIGGGETAPKPAPDPILKGCKLIKVKPDGTLYVGDTQTDIEAGRSAGCKTVIVTTSNSKIDLEKINDISIIDNLEELIKIL